MNNNYTTDHFNNYTEQNLYCAMKSEIKDLDFPPFPNTYIWWEGYTGQAVLCGLWGQALEGGR